MRPPAIVHSMLRLALLGASFMSLHAQQADIRRAEPLTEEPTPSLFPAETEKPGYIIPDFATTKGSQEEIKTPAPMTEEEQSVLRSAKDLSADELADLIQVYERMGNTAMQQSLGRILIERVPDHPVAKQMLTGIEGQPEIRKPDYLEQRAAEVLSGKAASDPDAVAAEARSLMEAKQTSRAVALLEALKKTTFPSQTFPYQEDLAYGYMDLGRWDDAEEAFKKAMTRRRESEESKEKLARTLELVRVEKRIAGIRSETYRDPDAALTESEKLIQELPQHPSAIAFRVECLQYAGKNAEALAMLEDLKKSINGTPAFPYQRLLGYAHQQLKQWDAAADVFKELGSNPVFSEEARKDAAKALDATSISKKGEQALMAAGFGDWEKAESLIAELEKEFPGNLEVFSYRCAFMARSGRQSEALTLLTDKRNQWSDPVKPFPLQDTIVDVYVAQKKFDLARAACQDILDNGKYDWSMRRRALDAVKGIRRAELLEAGFTALRDRRLERAKTAAKTLQEEFGAEARELRLLLAEIHLAQNKNSTARSELETLEKSTPEGQPFEAKSSLATANLRTGRLEESLEAYRDILKNHRAYTPYESMQARWEMRSAIPLVKPGIEVTAAHRSEQDGSVTRTEAAYTSPWWGAWRSKVLTHADFLQLKSTVAAVAQPWNNERYEAVMMLQRKISDKLAGEITLGGSQSDVVYGARIGNFLTPGLNWSAGFSGNARSTESIPLEALDARENRVDVAFGGALPGPWSMDIRAFANWVRVGTNDIGYGLGASAALEYMLQTETEKRGEIALGYLGEYRRFNPNGSQSTLSGLIDEETNRHGVTLAYRRSLGESWKLAAQVGGFYSIDESAFQYMGSLGVQHYFSDTLLAYLDLRYDSNSRSALDDSGAFEASVGMQKTF